MDWRILYNPMAVLRRGNALLVALVVIIILTAVAWWGGEILDGALDLHLVPEAPSARQVIFQSLVAWISLAVLLFAASRMFGGNGGLAGHFAASGLARFPVIFATIVGSRQLVGGQMLKATTIRPEDIVVRISEFVTPLIIIGSIVMVGLLAWWIVMLVYGFKEVSRLRGGKTAAAFVIGIILAEIVSKLILWGGSKIGI